MMLNNKLNIFLIAALTLYPTLVTYGLNATTNIQRVADNISTPTINGVYNDTSEALQYSKAIVQMIEDFIRDDLTVDLQPKGQLILQNTKHALSECENQLHSFTDITKYNQCAEFLLHSSLLSLANLKKPAIQQQPNHTEPTPTPTPAASGAARMKLFW